MDVVVSMGLDLHKYYELKEMDIRKSRSYTRVQEILVQKE